MFDGERKGIPILSIIGILNDDYGISKLTFNYDIISNNEVILEQVSLLYYSNDLNSWEISSDKGAMYDNSNILVLSGNVVIRNNSTLRPSIIETDYLEINPNKMTIATNKQVKISLNNNTIEAFGINAILEDNQIKFRTSNASTSME